MTVEEMRQFYEELREQIQSKLKEFVGLQMSATTQATRANAIYTVGERVTIRSGRSRLSA